MYKKCMGALYVLVWVISVPIVGMERRLPKKQHRTDKQRVGFVLFQYIEALKNNKLRWNEITPFYQSILSNIAERNKGIRALCEYAGADLSVCSKKSDPCCRITLPFYQHRSPSILFPDSYFSAQPKGQLGEYGKAIRKQLEERNAIIQQLGEGMPWKSVPENMREIIQRHAIETGQWGAVLNAMMRPEPEDQASDYHTKEECTTEE